MNQLETFLRQHAIVHSPEATGAGFAMDWVYGGLTDEQMRARPHGVNPVAWLVWHVARVEDACVAGIVVGVPQLLDDAWAAGLRADARGDGEGMSKDEVYALSDAIDLDALRAYRNAVCQRTRELVAGLWPDLWHAELSDDEIAQRVESGALSEEEAPRLSGRSRDGMLWWWAVEHTHYHLGQMALVRRLVTA